MQRSSAPTTRLAVWVCWLVVVSLSVDVQAGYWFWRPQLTASLDYQSNLTLNATEKESAVREAVETSALLGYENEQTRLALDSRISAQLVQGVEDRNTVDVSFDLASAYQTERDIYSLNTRLVLDTTLTSELEAGGTGFVRERKGRTLIQVAPSWRHALSENDSFVLSAAALDVSYEDEERIPLTNYQYFTFSGGYAADLFERWRLNANVQFARFESNATTETVTGLIGLDWEMDEINGFSGNVGLSRASSDQSSASGEDIEFRFGFDYRIVLENGRLNMAINRTESPDGSGELRTADALNLDWLQEFDSTLRLRVSAQFGESEGVQTDSREYRSSSVSLIKDLSRDASLELKYRTFWQGFDTDPSATNNVVQISFRKRWDERSL